MASVGDDAQVHIWGVTQDSSSSTPPVQVSTAGDDGVVSVATVKKRTFSP